MNSSIRRIRNYAVIVVAALIANGSAMSNVAKGGPRVACDDGPGSIPHDSCIEASDAETPWRYIARTFGSECPAATDWSEEKLFQQIVTPTERGVIPPGLDEFCLYVADTDVPNLAALTALQCPPIAPNGTNCLSQIEADSVSVALMSGDVADLISGPLRDHFRKQVGSIGPLPAAPQNVRVAFVDTEPDDVDEVPNRPRTSQHGFALMAMLRDLICPDLGNQCAVQLKSGLGLSLIRCNSPTGFCVDKVNGGYNGTITELAAAIRKEVLAWETSGVANLVINLSVAWNPLFGDDLANKTLASETVLRALQDASCRGALMIAAAGNSVTGPTANPSINQGPLLPAGWETLNAPDSVQCLGLLGTSPDPGIFAGSYRPLLYAASSLDVHNRPAETRVEGEPRLTAFGDHAVSQTIDAGVPSPTPIQTGTSVSTVVVSAAAAAAWHYRPGYSAHQIMEILYDSALPIGRQSDFQLESQPFDVRRVSVCHAVKEACSGLPTGQCPSLNCLVPRAVLPVLPEDAIAQLFNPLPGLPPVPTYSVTQLGSQMRVDACRSGYVLHSDGTDPTDATDDPCPHFQHYGVQATPWTEGQPEGQFCPTCVSRYRSPGTLYIEIDAGLQGTLSEITLVCQNDGYRLSRQLNPGDKLVITDIPEACESQDVTVFYRLDNNSGSPASAASPVLLISDLDRDGLQDGLDNCVETANPNQSDFDSDGIGDLCDCDFNNDCATNFPDLSLMRQAFFGTDPMFDLDGSGVVNFVDLNICGALFFTPPGPSGVDNICQIKNP